MVARELGISRMTVSMWVTGHHRPKDQDIVRLAALLGFDAREAAEMLIDEAEEKADGDELCRLRQTFPPKRKDR